MSKHHLLSPLFQISKLPPQPRKLVFFLLGKYLTFSIHLTTFMNMENVISHCEPMPILGHYRGLVVLILASLLWKLKIFWCVHYYIPTPTKNQKLINAKKDVEGSIDHRNRGGWKTMPFKIGDYFPY